MTLRSIFTISPLLWACTLLPWLLNAQGEITGKVVTQSGEPVQAVQVTISGTKANPQYTSSSGMFTLEIKDKSRIGGASVQLKFFHSEYILVKGNGYTWQDGETAFGIDVKQRGVSDLKTFRVAPKAKIRETGKKVNEQTLAAVERRAEKISKRGDLESRQQAFYLRQNKKSLVQYSERVNLEIQSEDNSNKSKAYLEAYNAMFVKNDFDGAFKALSDSYIDASLNAAKEKYRAAGYDPEKRQAAKRELDNAISDCVMKARLYVVGLEYDKAVDFYRKAVYANLEDPIIQNEFANFLNLIGKGYKDIYDFIKARQAFREAIDIREKLVKDDTGNEEYQYFKLLEAQNNLISLFQEFNQMNEAVDVYSDLETTLNRYLDFSRREVENPNPKGKKKKSAKEQKEAETKAHLESSDDDKLLVLTQLYSNLGTIKTIQKDYFAARDQFATALVIFAILKERDVIKPDILNLEMAQTCTNLGILFREWYRSKQLLSWGEESMDAKAWFEHADNLYDEVREESMLLVKAGKAHNYHQWALYCYSNIVDNPNNVVYAEKYFRQVDQLYDELCAENPKMFEPRRIKLLCDMFDFYISTKNQGKANNEILNRLNTSYQKNKDQNINLDAFTPEMADLLNHMGWIYHNQAKEKDIFYLDTSLMNPAKAWFEISKTEYERLDRENDFIFLPKKAYCYINLSYYYYSLHYALPKNEKKRIGLEYAEKAIADLDKYFDYLRKISRGRYRDYEAEQYLRYAKEVKRAFEIYSDKKKVIPRITTYNIYYPK